MFSLFLQAYLYTVLSVQYAFATGNWRQCKELTLAALDEYGSSNKDHIRGFKVCQGDNSPFM